MAKRRRRTQAEEVIGMLKREGFVEIPPEKIKEEPYRTIYALPSCFDEPARKRTRRPEMRVKESSIPYPGKSRSKK